MIELVHFGHVVRYPESRWVRTMLTACTTVTTKRPKRGRPQEAWRDRIQQDLVAKMATVEDCLDREKWKEISLGKTKGTRSELIHPDAFDSARPLNIREIRKAEGRQRLREVVGSSEFD